MFLIYLPSLIACTCMLLLSWSDRPDVFKLPLTCIKASVKPGVFSGFSWCFLQKPQIFFSFSENCSHVSFHFIFVLGFSKYLELECMLNLWTLLNIQKCKTESKTICIKIPTFLKRQVSFILWSFSS